MSHPLRPSRRFPLHHHQRLSGRIDDYEAALAALEGSEPYADRKEELDRDQAEHGHENPRQCLHGKQDPEIAAL